MRLLAITLLGLCAIPSHAQQQPIVQEPGTQSSVAQSPSTQQSVGSITGTVVDGTGATVVGARVALKLSNQAQNQEVLSGANGQFSFANVPPSDFQITITAKGFAPETSSGTLHSGEAFIVPSSGLAPAEADTAVQVVATQNDIAEAQLKIAEKQRVLGVFPNFYISYIPDAVPLSSKQKFELASRMTIDPVNFLMTGVNAGIQQSQNAYSGYGQGAQGYAKRFGANYADNATDTFIGGAILPSLLHQDPRYYYKGTGSTRSRLLYAIANLAVCKGDNKHWQPNYSGLLGGLASGGISNLYYPAKDRGAALTFSNFLIGMGTSAAVNIIQEFFIRKLTPNVPNTDPSKH